jgi:hypothetical protein
VSASSAIWRARAKHKLSQARLRAVAGAKRIAPEDLVFGNKDGKTRRLEQHSEPSHRACLRSAPVAARDLADFRENIRSWSHDKGVPDKVTAAPMGHSNVYTTLNVYTQVVGDSKKAAAQRIGNELFSIVQFSGIADGKGGIDSPSKRTQNEEVKVNGGIVAQLEERLLHTQVH